jgi:hypothetical protein
MSCLCGCLFLVLRSSSVSAGYSADATDICAQQN